MFPTVIEGSHLAIIDLIGAEPPFIVVVSTTPLTLEQVAANAGQK